MKLRSYIWLAKEYILSYRYELLGVSPIEGLFRITHPGWTEGSSEATADSLILHLLRFSPSQAHVLIMSVAAKNPILQRHLFDSVRSGIFNPHFMDEVLESCRNIADAPYREKVLERLQEVMDMYQCNLVDDQGNVRSVKSYYEELASRMGFHMFDEKIQTLYDTAPLDQDESF